MVDHSEEPPEGDSLVNTIVDTSSATTPSRESTLTFCEVTGDNWGAVANLSLKDGQVGNLTARREHLKTSTNPLKTVKPKDSPYKFYEEMGFRQTASLDEDAETMMIDL
ncbi:hypothetical protein PISL3812_03992 [Talaromyces islandicus]|uniref:Uncharacterized protein n=1 Tax=Talaromyces islandicus TaxID=28573 RepID=A0A0U1LUB2_TALIS|nr:hypothetical protein PISL3812_03992 [Talaromyces islandicus]